MQDYMRAESMFDLSSAVCVWVLFESKGLEKRQSIRTPLKLNLADSSKQIIYALFASLYH